MVRATKKPQTKGPPKVVAGNKKPTKDVGGRPSKMTIEIVEKLIECIKLDMTVSDACIYAGIDKKTYYNWINKNKGFSTKMEQAEVSIRKKVFEKQMDLIEKGDTYTIREWLKRRDARYGDKLKLQDERTHITVTLEHAEKLAKLAREAQARMDEKKRTENAKDTEKTGQ